MWRIADYQRAEAPTTEPVTKFGGQPSWLTEPQWPLSASWGTPMRFVCQIALDPELAGDSPARLAYIFVTHADHGRDADDFDPDVILPDGGENAVIVQPGGTYDGPTAPLTEGPTLYHKDGSPAEYTVELIRSDDGADEDDDVIGGETVQHDLPGDGAPWRPLLRLATNWTPFYLNLGAAPVAFAFLSADGRAGCLLVEDS
ncbi:hypothetical protein [Allorhizocola rhizosphaerae]|uniref:hypothetical protein n=1 Tax=Allorhizocola rhizosphaerae TaxID=1872709 RepID=UPI001B8B9D11|nr:hypothetical protein [Allorhizocola rhizosphaerae]